MAEFSAHRVEIPGGGRFIISTPVNLFVSTTGDDVLNTGIEEGSPFRTPQRALEFLEDKVITDSGFVTINFAAGIYDIEPTININHPNGDRIAFVGAAIETLILQNVSNYQTYGYEGFTGYDGYYSGTVHDIRMYCVKPDSNTGFTLIQVGINDIRQSCRFNGCGVIVQDDGLALDEDYNPVHFYASYPISTRNNIARQASILGAHVLYGVSGGTLDVTSSIRDDFFSIPIGGKRGVDDVGGTIIVDAPTWARYYGNAFPLGITSGGISYDTSENQSNNWLLPYGRGHYLSSLPIGYYGSSSVSGIPVGTTSNVIGASFPNNNADGGTGSVSYDGVGGWFTATGPAGSILKNSLADGPNYHQYIFGISGSAPLSTSKAVNANKIRVTLIPTVFRRFGNILSINSSGLRKIKNIFFDGRSMPLYYNLLGTGRLNTTGISNKFAVYSGTSKIGESLNNEPLNLESGLFSNCGIKDFHVGVYCDKSSYGNLGRVAVSNTTYGVIANNGSNMSAFGSSVTGSIFGFAAFNSSSLSTERCFSAFSGHSLVEMKLKSAPGNTGTFSDDSYIPGQTFSSNDGRIKGIVFDWDPVGKFLTIAVREGILEAKRLP